MESRDEADDYRWNLQAELAKPFNTVLKRTLGPGTKPVSVIGTCTKDDGDYECKTLIYIGPAVKKNRRYTGLKQARLAFMKNLSASASASDMIERSVLCLPGYVKFTISRQWIAKNIHKMLIDGIDTWAPKLPMKKAIVDFGSGNVAEDMDFGNLRTTIIADTIARIIEYSKVDVSRKSYIGDHQEISRKGYEKLYQLLGVHVEESLLYDSYIPGTLDLLRKTKDLIEESEGDEVIVLDGKELPLVKSDGGHYSALTDLTVLWHGLKEEKAEWIIYVTDVGKHDYIKMCIIAARYAEWFSADTCKHPINHVGVGHVEGDDLNGFQNSSNRVVDLFDEATSRCKAALVEQGMGDEWTTEELERTAQALGYGAVRYENLKTRRWANYTFSFDQMLNDKGNTASYLQYTHARICSIIRKFGKEIEELKNTGELLLKNDEERELGLHILRFNEVVAKVCLLLTPHILCEYLYDLAEKFNGLYSSSVCEQKVLVGSAKETNNLLLCEATAVVMRKCFHLLGITPITNTVPKQIQATSAKRVSFSKPTDEQVIKMTSRLNITNRDNDSTVPEQIQATSAERVYFSDLTDEQLIDIFDKCPLLRFELYSVLFKYENSGKNPKLFGVIQANARPGSVKGSLGADPVSIAFFSDIFNREYEDSVGIPLTGRHISLTRDICFPSVPASGCVQIVARLYVSLDEDNMDFNDHDPFVEADADDEEVKKDYVFKHNNLDEKRKYENHYDFDRQGDWIKFDVEKDDDDYQFEVDTDKITIEENGDVNNQVFQLCNSFTDIRLDTFARTRYGCCGLSSVKGPGCTIHLSYIVFKYAVDASMDVEFVLPSCKETKIVGSVIAYYGNDFEYRCFPGTEDHYKAILYETKPGVFVKPGKINLTRSVLAVPAKFSLKIYANLRDLASGVKLMSGSYEFLVPCDGSSSKGCIHGNDCSLNLKVDWKLPRDILPL